MHLQYDSSLLQPPTTQVLGMAGFGKEESRHIFTQVDTDGGGSVELDEFEAWWIESQRAQVWGWGGWGCAAL